MKKINLFLSVIILFTTSCVENKPVVTSKNMDVEHKKDSNGVSYETVANDPTGLRLYTLENGLKVYLSKNEQEPKIQTYIAVRAGSSYDPKQSTGLAHYLEHMMFKGTHKLGTLDWQKEQKFLKQISDLYEKHRAEKDPAKKKEIYKKIDNISNEASNYAIANEYDKVISSLGATGTNAHTWLEETIYKNKIPSNELNKWLDLESERFSTLVLRLFHTELEAVFEEFNQGQDNDYRKSYAAVLDGLFPNHPYGQQTTIGEGEHLKNPSMVDIHNYFDKYYVPNNMAIILVGDLEYDSTIKKISETFGKLKRKELKHPVLPKEKPITKPVVREVYGPTSEKVSISYRTGGINTADRKYVTLCDMILLNGKAGLIDLNLSQKQLLQSASSSPTFLNDYGYHSFDASPKERQTLDQVKDLILGEIEKLKKGEFEDWMIEAVINDLKLSKTKSQESSNSLASAYYNAFIHRVNWIDEVNLLDDLRKISKKDLVEFANRFYKDNYVVVYKRKGVDKNTFKVENPGITPINLNRGKKSAYLTDFNKIKSEPLQPKYVDYKKEIKSKRLDNGIEISYIENPLNDLFDLSIIFDMGSKNNKKLGLAIDYVGYLGTDKYTPSQFKQELYKLGVDTSVTINSENIVFSLSGLKENFGKGLELLEHLWSNAKSDKVAYDKLVKTILKSRVDAKNSKNRIFWGGLFNILRYGEDSPFRNIISEEDLNAFNPDELVKMFKELKSYKQRIFYYGKDVSNAVTQLNKQHKVPAKLKDYPAKKEYKELETGGKVYLTDYDMVQTEIAFVSKKSNFNKKDIALATLFNTYFGSGLSSIVFQEIRESKSLAYSAWSSYSVAAKLDKPNYVLAYVGTQANKLEQAVDAMSKLMSDLPESKQQFESAKNATLKKIAAQRITKSSIFWTFESLKRLGIDYDNREEVYNTIKGLTFEDLKAFFNKNIKGSKYSYIVIGSKKNLDKKVLEKLGKVEEVKLDYLFNY